MQVRDNEKWRKLGFELKFYEYWEKKYSSGDAKMVSHDLYTIIEEIYDSKNENTLRHEEKFKKENMGEFRKI